MAGRKIEYRNLGISIALIFILSFFVPEKQVTNEDIKSKNEFPYKNCKIEIKNPNTKVRTTYLVVNDTCEYSFRIHDCKYFDLENFRKELQPNDTVVVEHTCGVIYRLSKKDGKEYTNLKKANDYRKRDIIWARTFALISCLYCFLNAYYMRASTDGIFFIVWFIILLIMHGILTLIFGNIFNN
jgi:hypothetical protein